MNWRKAKKLWKRRFAPLVPGRSGRKWRRHNGSDRAIRTMLNINGIAKAGLNSSGFRYVKC